MSEGAERHNREEDINKEYDSIDDFLTDYAVDDDVVPDSMANGGTESDDEMGDGHQQLHLVQSAQGPGIQIRGTQVSETNVNDSQSIECITQATPAPSNTSIHEVTNINDQSATSGNNNNDIHNNGKLIQARDGDVNNTSDLKFCANSTPSGNDKPTASSKQQPARNDNNTSSSKASTQSTASEARPKTSTYSTQLKDKVG